jgi:hypothetical protein
MEKIQLEAESSWYNISFTEFNYNFVNGHIMKREEKLFFVSVFRIHDMLVWIRIRGFVPLTIRI